MSRPLPMFRGQDGRSPNWAWARWTGPRPRAGYWDRRLSIRRPPPPIAMVFCYSDACGRISAHLHSPPRPAIEPKPSRLPTAMEAEGDIEAGFAVEPVLPDHDPGPQRKKGAA